MTIAACFVLPEGVVVAADSTTTTPVPIPGRPGVVSEHYYEHGQKIFEVGENSAIGMATWGVGGLGETSYRTLIAEFGDELDAKPIASVQDAANAWAAKFWPQYADYEPVKNAIVSLGAMASLSPSEQADVLKRANRLRVGFVLFGRVSGSRRVEAHELLFAPTQTAAVVRKLRLGDLECWGIPLVIKRMLVGVDDDIVNGIIQSGKWTGTDQDLIDILLRGKVQVPPTLPIRDAADMLHALLHATIKVLRFSQHPPYCGGPIEVATVTSDRPFRWIKHKSLDAAIT